MNQYSHFYNQFSEEDLALVKEYLSKRYQKKRKTRKLGIVYDILHECDLACIGCGTDAKYHGSQRIDIQEPSLYQMRILFKKIKDYASSISIPVFMNIGGGEPFLRNDIIYVLKAASEHFGVSGVGVDTNGTLDESFSLISQAMEFSSYVGISINGLEEYHNWWAGTNRINPYRRSMETAKKLCNEGETYRDKLEITSVATKKNLKDIPVLMQHLADMGVKNYSIHRAMPVGRMFRHPELFPSAAEYFQLLIDVIKASRRTGLDAHIHHSIEAIHETLLLGMETYVPDKAGDPDIGSSIGIEPEGHVVFDPWCTSGMWKQLCSPGCIYDDNLSLESLLSDKGSVFDLTQTYTGPHLRCNGCKNPCSGGSRIVAAACELIGINEKNTMLTDLLSSMSCIDPACPLFVEDEDECDEF